MCFFINFLCDCSPTDKKVGKLRISWNFSLQWIEKSEFDRKSEIDGKVQNCDICYQPILRLSSNTEESGQNQNLLPFQIEKCKNVFFINFSGDCAPTDRKVGKVRISWNFSLQWIEKCENVFFFYPLLRRLWSNRLKGGKVRICWNFSLQCAKSGWIEKCNG